VNVRHRESKAVCTLKDRFSVVAPIRVICPHSTASTGSGVREEGGADLSGVGTP